MVGGRSSGYARYRPRGATLKLFCNLDDATEMPLGGIVRPEERRATYRWWLVRRTLGRFWTCSYCSAAARSWCAGVSGSAGGMKNGTGSERRSWGVGGQNWVIAGEMHDRPCALGAERA